MDVAIAAVRAEIVEGEVEHKEVLPVLAAGSFAPVDVLGKGLRFLHAHELRIIRHSDVHKAAEWLRAGGSGMELGVLDAVAVDLAHVQVLLDLVDFRSLDAVRHAPNALFRDGILITLGIPEQKIKASHLIVQGRPVRSLDQSQDTTGSFRRTSVVFTRLDE